MFRSQEKNVTLGILMLQEYIWQDLFSVAAFFSCWLFSFFFPLLCISL